MHPLILLSTARGTLFSGTHSVFHIFFQVPYALSLLFATLTKTAGVWGYSSQFGTRPHSYRQPAYPGWKPARCRAVCASAFFMNGC
jgi:hypothetical protein